MVRMLKTQDVTRVSSNGRIYHYHYGKRLANQPRKTYQHHPDWKPKEKPSKIPRVLGYRTMVSRLRTTIGHCQYCGETDFTKLGIHHKDGNGHSSCLTPNDAIDNLIVLCSHCHQIEHHKDRHPRINQIIEMRLEGRRFREIAQYFHVSRQRIHQIFSTHCRGLTRCHP